MNQPKYSSAMDDNNNNNGKEGGFPGFFTIINTSPMPSPSFNSMSPNFQVSANDQAKEGFADLQPLGPVQAPPVGLHATKDDSEQVPLHNDAKIANSAIDLNANSAKMPMPKSSTSVVSENYSSDPPISTTENVKSLNSIDQLEVTTELPHGSAADHENGATQGSMSFEEDAVPVVENTSESNKRKRESLSIQYVWPRKPSRVPKVIFHVESIEDVPDDGYYWRKYGQKIVKGNSNPRNYYKCSNRRCYVKKHVERDPDDAKYVITTYWGRHNHEVPPERKKNTNSLDEEVVVVVGADDEDNATNIPMPESQTLDGEGEPNELMIGSVASPPILLDLNLPPPQDFSLDEDFNWASPMGPEA